MNEYNPTNERIKRQYFIFLKEAKRHGVDTVDSAAMALARFEAYNTSTGTSSHSTSSRRSPSRTTSPGRTIRRRARS
jgi:hypothetical protein